MIAGFKSDVAKKHVAYIPLIPQLNGASTGAAQNFTPLETHSADVPGGFSPNLYAGILGFQHAIPHGNITGLSVILIAARRFNDNRVVTANNVAITDLHISTVIRINPIAVRTLSWFMIFTASTFLFDPSQVAEIFRSPDINMMLFFAFFMLDDPPTSPARYPDQIRFGLIVAVASFCIFIAIGSVWFLLAGLLIGNAWEAWRRVSARAARTVTA